MAADFSTQFQDLPAPGEILQEALEERGMTGAELARRLECSEKHVSQLLNGHAALGTNTALLLERVLGIPARLWNSLEFNYRSEQRRREQSASLTNYVEWARCFPIAEMCRYGYLAADLSRKAVDRVAALLNFFGVSSPEAWNKQWTFATARFRKSPTFTPKREALTAWLRRSEVEAQRISCASYDEDRFREALFAVRALTTSEASVFQKEAVGTFSEAGVALTFVPSLKGLALSGATRWIGADKAAIHLSLRGRTDDQLLFSLFHEACHVLEHRKQDVFIDDARNSGDDPAELRANEFARDSLIPPAALREFLRTFRGPASIRSIPAFAKSIDLAPGIIVGRLQHDGRLPRNTGNRLKRTFAWECESQ